MSGAAVAVEGLKGVDKIWHLRQAPLLKGFSLPDLTAIARICSDRIYSKGEVIFSEEDVADSICILNRGCVRISVVNAASGREKIIALFKTGDIFGENILGNPRKRSVQATAHDECWVSVLSRDNFLRLLSLKPGLALNMIEILTHQLTEAREDIGALSFLDTENRVATMLLKLADRHGKRTVADQCMVKLKISVSHDQLARMIGGNRPHISTIMSRFKKRGWVHYQGRKLLINADALIASTVPLHSSNGKT